MKKSLVIYILLLCSMVMSAQTDRNHIREGNRLFRQQKFDKAEVDYRKAVDKNNKNPQAFYNLGCALMQQQKDSLALIQFETAGKLETSNMRKAKVYHNIGVVCQGHKMFSEAIEAYKESLRNNPKDNETRYNLALCQHQLKNQKNDKNNQNQKNNKDKKNEGNDKKNQSQDDENKNKENKNKNQQQKEQMSKDNAEQLLQAALQDEKNTQQKMKKQQSMPQKRRLQKNW